MMNITGKRFNFLKISLVIVCLSILSACVTKDGHTYIEGRCVTCLNNPITNKAINHNNPVPEYGKVEDDVKMKKSRLETKSSKAEAVFLEGQIKFSVLNKIDVAYLKLKREFGFKTRKERERNFGRYKGWLDSAEEFRYEALAGVSYHMREHTKHSYKGVNSKHTIDMILETNGAGTNVVITYWIQKPKSTLRSYSKSLKHRSLQALK